MDLLAALLGMFGSGSTIQQPQAMTRQTRTPIYWQHQDNPNVYGEYRPLSDAIYLNPDKIPQANPNMEDLNSVLRHEQVHKLLAGPLGDVIPSTTQMKNMGYIWSNPDKFQQMRQQLGQSGVPNDTMALSQEAPAYAVQGHFFGQNPHEALQQYTSRMPDAVRKKYMTLLGPVAQDAAQGLR